MDMYILTSAKYDPKDGSISSTWNTLGDYELCYETAMNETERMHNVEYFRAVEIERWTGTRNGVQICLTIEPINVL